MVRRVFRFLCHHGKRIGETTSWQTYFAKQWRPQCLLNMTVDRLSNTIQTGGEARMGHQPTTKINHEMELPRAGMLYKCGVGHRDAFLSSGPRSRHPLKQFCIKTLWTFRKSVPRITIKMPSMSYIIVAAAALFTFSAPVAAAKKDCREGTYYCGKDLLAIGNFLEFVDANTLLILVAT